MTVDARDAKPPKSKAASLARKRWLGRAGLVVLVAALAASWLLFPGPFAHGVVVGICIVGVVLAGGIFTMLRIVAVKRKHHVLAPPPITTPTWDFQIALTDLERQPVSFDRDAKQIVVLNFWATWCPPCLAEMPSLQRLRDATADLDVRFGFVTSEERSVVTAFLVKRPLDLPIYFLSGDTPACFSGRGIPATFVIDKEGTIALRHFGAAAWDAPQVVTFVRGLAAKPG